MPPDVPCGNDVGDELALEHKEPVDSPGTITGTKLSVVHTVLFPILGQLWFLTIGPLVGITVFFAELAKRQDCRRVFEDSHRHEELKVVNMCCGFPHVFTHHHWLSEPS